MTGLGNGAGLRARLEKQFTGRQPFHLQAQFSIGGGITVLFGASGAGKSTLLDCLAGILTPDCGRVELVGTGSSELLFDSDAGVDKPLWSRRIGYVFQNMALFPHMSAAQNVEYGLASLPKAARRERSQQLLEGFRVAHLARRRPGEISGGERQRVALARTLAPEPRLLLLDEPLSALDVATKAAILDDLRRWQQDRSAPVLYVTHSRGEALRAGGHILILDGGRIVAQGEPQAALASFPRLDD